MDSNRTPTPTRPTDPGSTERRSGSRPAPSGVDPGIPDARSETIPESRKVEVDFFVRGSLLEGVELLRDAALERAAASTRNTRSSARIEEVRRHLDAAEHYEELMNIFSAFKSGSNIDMELTLVHSRRSQ